MSVHRHSYGTRLFLSLSISLSQLILMAIVRSTLSLPLYHIRMHAHSLYAFFSIPTVSESGSLWFIFLNSNSILTICHMLVFPETHEWHLVMLIILPLCLFQHCLPSIVSLSLSLSLTRTEDSTLSLFRASK